VPIKRALEIDEMSNGAIPFRDLLKKDNAKLTGRGDDAQF
jgi:hypothetical protein